MSNTEQLVVVLSRSYSTGLCVVRSLGAAGYTIDVVASATKAGDSDYLGKSKYVRNHMEVLTKKVKENDDEELVNALLSYKGQCSVKPVLISTDDYTCSVMDMNRDALKEVFIMPGITDGLAGSLKHHMDKSVQGEIARRVGILTPQEWVVSLREEEIIIPDDMIYPCYVKPIESSLGYKTEMAKCDDKEALNKHLYWMKERFSNRSILVQRFLEIDEEIDMEGICMDQEVILPGIVWKRVVAQRDKGVPLEGVMFPVEKLGEFTAKIKEFLREFHYFGMFDLGFNIVGNDIYFNELNVRSGGTNFVYFGSGVNLPDIFIKLATGRHVTEEETKIKEFGKSYIYEKVAWTDYLHDFITKEELDKWTAEADIKFIVREDDPVPGEIFMESMAKADRRKQRLDNCVAETVAATGWDKETAMAHIKATRMRSGITYKDYIKCQFWNIPDEQQEEEYKRILEKRERIKQQRERCIIHSMETAGWTREHAEEKIKEARKRLGITYNDYRKYNFCLIPEKDQQEEYEKVLVIKAKKKEEKNGK